MLRLWTTGTAAGTALRSASDAGFDGVVLTHPQTRANSNSISTPDLCRSNSCLQAYHFETRGHQHRSRRPRRRFEALRVAGVDSPNVPNYVPWDPMMTSGERVASSVRRQQRCKCATTF